MQIPIVTHLLNTFTDMHKSKLRCINFSLVAAT